MQKVVGGGGEVFLAGKGARGGLATRIVSGRGGGRLAGISREGGEFAVRD